MNARLSGKDRGLLTRLVRKSLSGRTEGPQRWINVANSTLRLAERNEHLCPFTVVNVAQT